LAESERIVCEVARAVGLAEGGTGVRAVLAALARLEPVSIRRLSRAVELPVPIVAAVCGELRKRSIVAGEHPAQLTAPGRALFAANLLRLGRDPAAELKRAGRALRRCAERAPAPRLDLDQCHCTVETKLRRVLALHEADALVGRRVLFLGDDDLTSLAVREIVSRFGSPDTVPLLAVVDVDPKVVAFVQRELATAPFPVSTIVHDLRRPLPPSLVRAFDTVVTDPPYTDDGVRLFLSRAVDALAGQGGRIFLSFGSRRPGSAFELQRTIVALGLAIRRLIPDFNEYLGAGALGGSSHLYELVATPGLRPVVRGTYDGALYTADPSSALTR
jgi:predicted methyltransferase